MSEEKLTISLEDFLKYFIEKWKMSLTIILISTVLFAAGAKFLGDEIVVPHSEEYLWYEQELERHQTYLEESVLMNLDPTCIYNRTLFVRDISDEELLKDYVLSSEIWSDFNTEWSKKYILELVSWSMNESTGTVSINLKHATSEDCLAGIQHLDNKIKNFDQTVETIIGAETISKDENLQEEHLRWYSRIDYVSSMLLDSQAGYTIKVSFEAAILTGILAGTVVSVFVSLIIYELKGKKQLR